MQPASGKPPIGSTHGPTKRSPTGYGCVAAVACRGSCGTGFSSTPTSGGAFVGSGRYGQTVLETSTRPLRHRLLLNAGERRAVRAIEDVCPTGLRDFDESLALHTADLGVE